VPRLPLDKTTESNYNHLEWDPMKSKRNHIKHGISFEHAAHVFNEPYLEILDNRKNYGEERFIVIGALLGRIVIMVYTPRNDKKRIISLRKANEREQKIYKQRLQTFGCNG
jgi:uncharacterized DUF497 family protein